MDPQIQYASPPQEEFIERGEYTLKGIPEPQRLFSVGKEE